MSNNQEQNPKKPKKTLYQFLDKEGFYIILFLCVSIVAVTALWISNQEPDPIVVERLEEEQAVPSDLEVLPEDTEEESPAAPEEPVVINPEPEPVQEQAPPETEPEEVGKEEETEKPEEIEEASAEVEDKVVTNLDFPLMSMPVLGKLGTPFATDRLVYHKTLNQWSTHKGLDILAEEGAPVKAVLDGQVVEVTSDTVMGISITIEHNEDLLTRYSNLSTDAMVKVGDQVSKGQVISAVGKTASSKALEGPLLHFQVIVDGDPVNPQAYLPKTN